MTLYEMSKLPRMRELSRDETEKLDKASNAIFDSLSSLNLSEKRQDALVEVMTEAATQFLQKGL